MDYQYNVNCIVELLLSTYSILHDSPEGTPEMQKAFLAGRKWVMKTYKRHGLQGVKSRWVGMIGTQRNESDMEAMFRILGIIEALRAYDYRRTPPMWPDAIKEIKETVQQLTTEIVVHEKTNEQPALH